MVVEHRLLKEKQRLKAEQEEREKKAATKVCPRTASVNINFVTKVKLPYLMVKLMAIVV